MAETCTRDAAQSYLTSTEQPREAVKENGGRGGEGEGRDVGSRSLGTAIGQRHGFLEFIFLLAVRRLRFRKRNACVVTCL